MNKTLVMTQEAENHSLDASIQETINSMIDDLIASLPAPDQLSSEERRGIIARYSAVLEGNFIYWMTATYMAVKSEEGREILLENLHEEIRDAHPVMLRRFAVGANAFPTDTDALSIDEDLTNMRRFLGRLSAVQSVVAMGFFEGFIQKFMAYLADLAKAQGSSEMEYTDVHGVCDIEHTAGLFKTLSLEMEANPLAPEKDLFEGVYLLRTLIENIVFNRVAALSA
jgi:hypothetical protein